MHLALTDILTCPRCGPPFGLILLAEDVRERRVLEGVLGCANCRERYPVRGGFAELRWPRGEATPGQPFAGDAPAGAAPGGAPVAERLAALIGMGGSGGGERSFSLVLGPGAGAAAAMAGLVPGAEVVVADPSSAGWPELSGVSRMAVAAALPFADRSVRGVALTAGSDPGLLEDAARVLNPMGRLLVEEAGAEVEARLVAAGLRVVAREGSTLVAVVA